MQFIKLLKNILLKSQIYVSFCATLLGIFMMQEQESYQFSVVSILFLTFWNGYFFIIFHKKKDAIFWNLVGFIIISFLIFYFQNLHFYIKWLIILFLGFIYNTEFHHINLREFSLIKTFYVGFIWAMSLVWLPLGNHYQFDSINILSFIRQSFHDFHWQWFLVVFLFVSAITFPFEIRDLKRDNFPTLPMKIGVQNTKYLSYIFLFVSCLFAIKFLKLPFAEAFFITVFFAYILVYFSDKQREDWYYSFLIESLSLMPFVFYGILKLF